MVHSMYSSQPKQDSLLRGVIFKQFSEAPTSGAASPSALSVCLLGVTVTNGAEQMEHRKVSVREADPAM